MSMSTSGIATSGYTSLDTMPTSGVVDPGVSFVNLVDRPNRFRTAERHNNSRRKATSLVSIDYEQDGSSKTMTATPGKTIFSYMDDMGVSQRKESRDFLIEPLDLVIDGVVVMPKKGDIITEEDFDLQILFKYEVGAFNGEPHYRFSGIYREVVRIHTKLIKKETI